MQKISGNEISQGIVEKLKLLSPPPKIFAVVLVGEDPLSISFIKQKEKTAKKLGIDFRLYTFPESSTNDSLRRNVGQIARGRRVGGVVVQLPLPKHINAQYVLNVIPREKDIDVLGERALGAFYANRNPISPPAVGTIEIVLEEFHYDIGGKKVVIVGLGTLVGKPVATWAMSRAGTVILVNSKGDLRYVGDADLVITGTGQARLIKPSMLKDGAGVIDFGYAKGGEKLVGDFAADELTEENEGTNRGGFYTPTPGGTGPILVAKLLANFYSLTNVNKKE